MKNFDKFKTLKERHDAFFKYCDGRACMECPVKKLIKNDAIDCCMAFWLNLEAVEDPLPCPFCGGEVKFEQMLGGDSVRCKCGYCAIFSESESEAIAAHNLVAKAVMAAKKGEM